MLGCKDVVNVVCCLHRAHERCVVDAGDLSSDYAMHAVGPDDHVGFVGRTIGARGFDTLLCLLNLGDFFVAEDAFRLLYGIIKNFA